MISCIRLNKETNNLRKVFNGDITGPEDTAIEVDTATNGSYESLSGNFSLIYGERNLTASLPFDASAKDVKDALEVGGFVRWLLASLAFVVLALTRKSTGTNARRPRSIRKFPVEVSVTWSGCLLLK